MCTGANNLYSCLISLYMIRPKKNELFVSCNGPKKNRVGRSVKKKNSIIFLVKNVFFCGFLWIKTC